MASQKRSIRLRSCALGLGLALVGGMVFNQRIVTLVETIQTAIQIIAQKGDLDLAIPAQADFSS